MPPKNLLQFLFILCTFVSFSQQKNVTQKEVLQLLNSSDSCLYKSDYKNSLSFSSKALNFALEMENDNLIARSYNSIAGNYEEIMEIDKALEYYDKAIFHFEKASNDTLKAAVFNNIGNIYFFRKKELDKGIEFYDESIKISESINNVYSIVLSKLNLASLYFEKNEYEKGIFHLNYVEKNRDFIKIVAVQGYLNILLGKKFSYLKQYDKAENYFKEAIKVGEENNSKIYLSDAYKDYSEFLFNIKNYKDAYVYLNKHEILKNEIFDLEKIKNAKIIGMDIALDETKRQLNIISKEKTLQADNLKKTKIIVALILVFLFMMMFLLYVLYRNNIFRRKINDFLETKNEELKIAKEKRRSLQTQNSVYFNHKS